VLSARHSLCCCRTSFEPAQKFPQLAFLKELSFRTGDAKHAQRVVAVSDSSSQLLQWWLLITECIAATVWLQIPEESRIQ
jgi:hypothetical protein